MACTDSRKSSNVLHTCLILSTTVAILTLSIGLLAPFWITVTTPENSWSFTESFEADSFVPSKNFKAFLTKMIENDKYLGLLKCCIRGNDCISIDWISWFISSTFWHAWPDEFNALIDFWIATRAFAIIGYVNAVIVSCNIVECIWDKKWTGRCAYGFKTIVYFITGGLLCVSLVVFYYAVRDLASKENVSIGYSFWMTCIASTLYILNGFTFVFAILTGKGNIGRKNTEKDIGAALLQLSRLLKSTTGTIERQTTKALKEEEIGAALLHLSCLLRSRTDTIRRQNAKATKDDEIVAKLQRVSCVLMSMTDTIERQNIKATKEKRLFQQCFN